MKKQSATLKDDDPGHLKDRQALGDLPDDHEAEVITESIIAHQVLTGN